LSKKTNPKNSDNYALIAEILGLLEEKGLSKDWLIAELKRHHVKTSKSLSSNTFEILKGCKLKGLQKILGILREEDIYGLDVKTMTKTLHWFFIDIISSADPSISVKAQARKVNALNVYLERAEIFKKSDLNSLVILPTGDGMAMGFPDSPEKPLLLAIQLHKGLTKYNKSRREKDRVHTRIGLDTGPVYFMKGVAGSKIFWGPGLIIAKRVMDLCGPDQIFASDRIAKDLRKLSEENKATLRPIGEYSIKYGERLLIYNIFGQNFGRKTIPQKDKVAKEKEEIFGGQPEFEFNKIELLLDVTDPKSMKTHHTWIWDIKNISKKPLEQLYYSIGGDIPKDFSELNVKITDENKNNLEIISLDANRPHEKAFYVKLKKPLRRTHKNRIIKLEYDWEEPERVFEYVFSARCKKFKYAFTIPKGVPIKYRILEVIKELGMKKRVEDPAPKIKYLSKKTQITWETDKNQKIRPNDAFEFQW